MRNKDKELLARRLHELGWQIHFPIIRPPLTSWDSAPAPSSCEHCVGTIDFRRHIVTTPLSDLTFDEIRGIWEQIVLFSEVA